MLPRSPISRQISGFTAIAVLTLGSGERNVGNGFHRILSA
ncbi:MAG: hypothetical protein RL077_4478 [Verrucomicrobiota bacterium]|jgi:hypothetical protein